MITIKESTYRCVHNQLIQYPEFKNDNLSFKTQYNTASENLNLVKKYGFDKFFFHTDFFYGIVKLNQLVHRIVPSGDKLITNPCEYNGFELLSYCLKGYGLNCTGYSIILNEILLTLGYKSKCIWCLSSKHPYDNDCHALNHVLDPHRHTWFVVDSAFGCIPVKNHMGMDIFALRDCLIKNEPFDLLKSIKMYGDSYKSMYSRYLTKNIFMFLVLKSSGLIYDTKNNAILVVPVGFERNQSRDYPYPYFITQNRSFIEE